LYRILSQRQGERKRQVCFPLLLFLILCRKSKKSGPRLVQGDITKYKPGSVECEGIQWGYRQILDIFLPLCEVADDADVYPESLNLSETAPDSLAKWFKADIAAVKKETQAQQSGQSGDSWFSRLATVCDTTLIQLIYIHFEFLDLSGKKPFKKASLVADLVRRVPTPPMASGQFDHFPMNSATLQQWVRYFESDSHSEVTDLKPTALLDIESLERDEFADINPDVLADDLRSAHNVDHVIGQSVIDAFADNGFDLDNYTESDFFNVLSYPPAPVLPFQPSPFAKAMDSCNIYGQAAIMFRRFDQERTRMLLLTASCNKQIGLLNKIGMDLQKKVDEYEEGRQILMSRGSEFKVTDKNVKDLQKSVGHYEQHSALKEYYDRNEGMRRELDRNQKRNSAGPEDRRRFSPFQASPLAAPAVRHPSAPVASSTTSFHRPLSAYFGESAITLFGTDPPADVLGLSQDPIADPITPGQPTSTVNGIIPAAGPAKGVSSRTEGMDEFAEEVSIMKEMGLDGIPNIPDTTLQK